MCSIQITPVIATERLILRGAVQGDAEAVRPLADDWGVAGMLSSMPYPYASADAQAWEDRAVICDFDKTAEFVIEHRNFGVVGVIGFKPDGDGRTDLGYWLGRPYWNRGYATEAARAALKWVKRDWRKRFVVAGHYADNPASGQVLCKAGFLYTGEVEQRASKAREADAPLRKMVWLA